MHCKQVAQLWQRNHASHASIRKMADIVFVYPLVDLMGDVSALL